MTPAEVQRALRLITSPTQRRQRYFPASVIAALAGLSRTTLYHARAGNRLTPGVVASLAPILTSVLAGKLQAKRNGGYTLTERSQSDVTRGGRQERRFSPPARTIR